MSERPIPTTLASQAWWAREQNNKKLNIRSKSNQNLISVRSFLFFYYSIRLKNEKSNFVLTLYSTILYFKKTLFGSIYTNKCNNNLKTKMFRFVNCWYGSNFFLTIEYFFLFFGFLDILCNFGFLGSTFVVWSLVFRIFWIYLCKFWFSIPIDFHNSYFGFSGLIIG